MPAMPPPAISAFMAPPEDRSSGSDNWPSASAMSASVLPLPRTFHRHRLQRVIGGGEAVQRNVDQNLVIHDKAELGGRAILQLRDALLAEGLLRDAAIGDAADQRNAGDLALIDLEADAIGNQQAERRKHLHGGWHGLALIGDA